MSFLWRVLTRWGGGRYRPLGRAALGAALLALLGNSACSASRLEPVHGREVPVPTAGPPQPENVLPEALVVTSPGTGPAPLTVALDGGGSRDLDGEIVDYRWVWQDGRVDRGSAVTRVLSLPGCHRVTLLVTDDRGAVGQQEQVVVATAGPPPPEPPLVQFHELPPSQGLLPRQPGAEAGLLAIRGRVVTPGYDAVEVGLFREGSLVDRQRRLLCPQPDGAPFDLRLSLPVELARFDVAVALVTGPRRLVVRHVEDIVAGDVLLIQGQSNAVARWHPTNANDNQMTFLRSFGLLTDDPEAQQEPQEWCRADGIVMLRPGFVGQWGLRMGRLLVESQGVPLAVLNGARGGRSIRYFLRNDADPGDLSTNYGRLLHRAQAAGLVSGVRAVLFFQGESDGDDAEGHRAGVMALYRAWHEDFPNLERVYVTQVRRGCGGPTIELRDGQRRLADDLDRVAVMSTTGLDGHDGCHFHYEEGYRELGERYAALVARDLYGEPDRPQVEPPNPGGVFFSSPDGRELTVTMRRTDAELRFDAGAQYDFRLEGSSVRAISGRAAGSQVVLQLNGDGRGAWGLSYYGHARQGPWVTNRAGVGLLAFFAEPLEGAAPVAGQEECRPE